MNYKKGRGAGRWGSGDLVFDGPRLYTVGSFPYIMRLMDREDLLDELDWENWSHFRFAKAGRGEFTIEPVIRPVKPEPTSLLRRVISWLR